jgi:hypothetical protein
MAAAVKKKTLAQLKKELDGLHSQWIRRKDAVDGMATCVTCGAVKIWTQQQCGHYISRVHLSTRFEDLNTHVQCLACNVWRNGNMDEYALYLERKFGFAALLELNNTKRLSVKFSRSDYEEMIEDRKRKLAQLEDGRIAA